MSTVEMSQQAAAAVDLEYGGYGGGADDDSRSSSVCFSDAEEDSCYSQFYSTADGDDDEIMAEEEVAAAIVDSQSVSESEFSVVDVINGFGENKVKKVQHYSGNQEKDCRICHLSLASSGPEYGIAIELGCSCKHDLAAAHKHCADTWFKIKGNKTCEICNSVARNIVGPNDIEAAQQSNDSNATTASTTTTLEQGESTSDTGRGCFDGRFVNFLLACMVFAFVLSWLFHFNVHS